MNPEYAICTGCTIRKRCHPEITPVLLNAESNGTVPALKYEPLPDWNCLAFTCTGDGARGAYEAIAAGRFSPFTVTELNNDTHDVEATYFGSQSKPTDRLKLRIVTREGHIYAKGRGGRFFRAHKILTFSGFFPSRGTGRDGDVTRAARGTRDEVFE